MDHPTIVITCLRFHPDTDTEPRWQAWTLPYRPDQSLLQALQAIKDGNDGSLGFRWSCRMGVCGSCGMMVNGEPQLACQVFLRDLHPGPVRVEPLAHFPILRDLVIDQRGFLDHLTAVRPYLVPATPPADARTPYRQTPRQMEAFLDHAQCINCLLCYAACPQYGLDPGFIGPAALALLHRYNADSRDVGWAARRDVANAETGVWGCTLVGACSEVCPKGVDPAHAINQNKMNSLLDYVGIGRLRRQRGSGGEGA